MGTASVVVRGSAAAEPIADGENGLLCTDDPADLADVIAKVLDDPALAERLGARARETIYLPWNDVIDHTLERYRYLIEKKRTASQVPLESTAGK